MSPEEYKDVLTALGKAWTIVCKYPNSAESAEHIWKAARTVQVTFGKEMTASD